MSDLTITSLTPLLKVLPWFLPGYLAILYLFNRVRRASIPPVEVHVKWTAFHILLTFFVVNILLVMVVYLFVVHSGFGARLYSPDLVVATYSGDSAETSKTVQALLGGGGTATVFEQEVQITQVRLMLWVSAFAFPLQLMAIPVLLRIGQPTLPQEMGLTWQHGWLNVGLGCLICLVIAPLVYAVNLSLQVLYVTWIPGGPSAHPFAEVFQAGLQPRELGLIILLAMVAAPMMEEIIFRGLIQPWISQESRRRWIALIIPLAMVGYDLIQRVKHMSDGSNWLSWVDVLAPLTVLILLAGVLGLMELPRFSGQTLGIVTTSILFAYLHLSHWPTPIALFVLALGLGWLAARTGSLVGPIVAHSLFNGIAAAQMLIAYLTSH